MVASVSQSSASRSAARVLVVEDDPDIAELLTLYLEKAGHAAERLEAGDAVVSRLVAGGVDLVILDVMLPGLDGFAVFRLMRADPATTDIPVIMLTARGEEADRIDGLELGADDYLTKPFSPKELVARVAARLRRTATAAPPASTITHGPISIDAERHVVTDNGTPVKLTAKKFLLLQYLVQHRARVVSRDLLLTDVCGYQYTGGTRTVDVHIRRLREKLPVLDEGIETVKRGRAAGWSAS
jgi:two-component system, OmpR family, alkaline phosphatase synthesis response regulator PhoP